MGVKNFEDVADDVTRVEFSSSSLQRQQMLRVHAAQADMRKENLKANVGASE